MEISRPVRGHVYKHMSRDASDPDHASGMLDGIVRVDQLYSHRAYLGALADSQHLFQPAGSDHCHIVIQKQQILPFCVADAVIIDGGIIKFLFPSQKTDPGICRKLFIIAKDLFCCTVVFNDQYFIIGILCFFTYGLYAGPQSLLLILIWNDNRDQRFSLNRIRHPVKSKIRRMTYRPPDSGSFQMSLYSPLSGVKGVHLAGRIICCGSLMSSPVIKDFRDMPHLFRLLYAPENEIIVLGPVKLLAETARLLNDRTPYYKEMTDIII